MATAARDITDTYDYDAFGNLISAATFCPTSGIAASNAAPCTPGSSPAATPNEFLFAGEQYDAETGHYYNRARYLNTTTGRFMTMDTYEGTIDDPLTLHKYLYTQSDPVDGSDPSGNQDDVEEAMSETLDSMPVPNFLQEVKGVSDSLQLCCRSDVIQAMKTIWQESSNGTSAGEATFTVNGSLTNYTIQVQPYTNERDKQKVTINLQGSLGGATFALFRVHPNNSGPKPSTPGNNVENNGLGDTGLADKYKFDVYLVSRSGLWMYSWQRKQDIQLRQNLDWDEPCTEKPLLPPTWVSP